MQRHLIPPEPYVPLPTTARSYVPVLQDRNGERTALRHASTAAWSGMTPLIEVVPWGNRFSAGSIRARAANLRDVVGRHPIYLDVKDFDPTTPIEASSDRQPMLELLFEAATRRELRFLPVAWSDSSDAHLKILAAAVDTSGRGLALRHRLNRVLPSGVSVEARVRLLLRTLGVEPSEVDLMLDLEYLDPDGTTSVRWLTDLMANLGQVGSWRSTVLIATSMPSSFGNGLVPPNTTRELPRHEWELWKEVAAASDVPLAYGDYAVQNPVPPPNPPPVGPFANIRYTSTEVFLVARGQDTRRVGREQYQYLSQWVVGHPAFRGASYSYGDREIMRWSTAAAGPVHDDFDLDEGDVDPRPGDLSYWRGVGTSHHLEQVSEQLRVLP